MLTTNWPRLARMPKPNLPIVKAMAPESGERRHVYDDPYDAKQRVRDIVDQRDETLAALAHLTQCEIEQDGNEQHRQEISLRDRAEQVGGDHLHQEIDDRQRFGARHVAGNRLFVQRGRRDVQAGARLPQIANDKPDHQGDRRDHLEIDDRPQADHADSAHTPYLGDADRHGGEDDRRHDRADQRDEAVAERPHVNGQARIDGAEQAAERDPDQNLRLKLLQRRSWSIGAP